MSACLVFASLFSLQFLFVGGCVTMAMARNKETTMSECWVGSQKGVKGGAAVVCLPPNLLLGCGLVQSKVAGIRSSLDKIPKYLQLSYCLC